MSYCHEKSSTGKLISDKLKSISSCRVYGRVHIQGFYNKFSFFYATISAKAVYFWAENLISSSPNSFKFPLMRTGFVIVVLWMVFCLPLQAQTILEEDEGLGQYDYLCITDSTWIHWSTDWATWSAADVLIHLPGESVNFPSIWQHDWGGRKHLSTQMQVSYQHFSNSVFQPGNPISFDLKLDGNVLNSYTNEMMLFSVVKEDVSGYIYNTTKQLVLQFYIDVGTASGNRWLKGIRVKNLGTLEEGDGDKDIGYDGLRLYYETGTSFHFDGTEDYVTLWGDWDGDSKYNGVWQNLGLNIMIPAGQRLYCYAVIESFSPTLILGRTAWFEMETDGLWMDDYGIIHKGKARIDARTNAFALPVVSTSFSPPSVVVSSYFNGADTRDEWTELLVTSDNVDLRGFSIRDNNNDQNSWQPYVTFKNIDFWNHLRAGTIIKLWHRPVNSSGEPHASLDASKADGYLELVLNDANYFEGGSFGTAPSYGGTTMSIAASGEIVQLRDASGTHVHALAHKATPGLDYNSMPLPKLNHAAGLTSGDELSICPGSNLNEYGVLDPQNGTTYTFIQTSSASLTPGLPNQCTASASANTDFWRLLRQPQWNNPSGSGSYSTGNTSVVLNWNACTDPYPDDYITRYLILRNTTHSFTAPYDGAYYSVGQLVGDALVAGVVTGSQTTTFTDPTPAPCDGVVYYRIYAFRYAQDEPQGNSFHPARGPAYNETSYAEITVNGPVSPNTSLIWHN